MPKPSLSPHSSSSPSTSPFILSNRPLSLSNLTGIASSSLNLNSENIGVVEIMLLHLLEKAISSKTNWILETKNSMTALQRLRLTDRSPPMFVVPEPSPFSATDISEGTYLPDHRKFDPDIAEMERELVGHVSILTKLFWKYNLVPSIISTDPALADFIPSTGQTIDWRCIQLTRLRWSLLRVFSHREETIPFAQRRPPERSVSVENFVGAFARMSSSRSNPSLNTSVPSHRQSVLTETLTVLEPIVNVQTNVPRSTQNPRPPPPLRLASKFPPLQIDEDESSPLFHDPSRYTHGPTPPFTKPTSAISPSSNLFHRKNPNLDTPTSSTSSSSEPIVLGRSISIATLEAPSAGLAGLASSLSSSVSQQTFENPTCSLRTATPSGSVIHRIAATKKLFLAHSPSTPPNEKSHGIL